MAEKCYCGLSLGDAARGTPYRDPGFRKVICGKCSKEIYTDIEGKTLCFDCERSEASKPGQKAKCPGCDG